MEYTEKAPKIVSDNEKKAWHWYLLIVIFYSALGILIESVWPIIIGKDVGISFYGIYSVWNYLNNIWLTVSITILLVIFSRKINKEILILPAIYIVKGLISHIGGSTIILSQLINIVAFFEAIKLLKGFNVAEYRVRKEFIIIVGIVTISIILMVLGYVFEFLRQFS